MTTAFIGGGNMATALISGLIRTGSPATSIRVSDPSREARDRLGREHGVACFGVPGPAVDGAGIVVVAVKPQVMPDVLAQLADIVRPDQLVISVAAGITVQSVAAVLGGATPVVRAMPNTPALLGRGITGLYAGPACDARHAAMAEAVMSAVGTTVWIEDEGLMDVVTAISGSGPAYYYLLTEALFAAGMRLGLPAPVAEQLARHTAHGAGAVLATSNDDVAELRRRVTSPGGTTEAAVASLQSGGFERLVREAVEAATIRGRELACGGTTE